ncbi:hypothetical protein QBC47DRAFT_81431, partial [Echria macrotheca]
STLTRLAPWTAGDDAVGAAVNGAAKHSHCCITRGPAKNKAAMHRSRMPLASRPTEVALRRYSPEKKDIKTFRQETTTHHSIPTSSTAKMKLASTVFLAAACFMPSLTAAKKCTNGLFYCGYNLDKKGDYRGEMAAENKRVGVSTEPIAIWYTLYYCGAGGDGWIRYAQSCDKCYDGGPGKSDFC